MNYTVKSFQKSSKRAPQLPPLFSLSFHFSNIASNECWELNVFRNSPWYFDNIFLVWEWFWEMWQNPNWSIIWLIMTVFFLIYRRYIGIFQRIGECWIFDVLIETFSEDRCYCLGVPLENPVWYITFWFRFFTVDVISFPFYVLNIETFKRNKFGSLRKLYMHEIIQLPLVMGRFLFSLFTF